MREQKICSWIHHIATFIGVFIGMKRLLEKRGGIIRKGILGLFLDLSCLLSARFWQI